VLNVENVVYVFELGEIYATMLEVDGSFLGIPCNRFDDMWV
jgi:hypothetical protein